LTLPLLILRPEPGASATAQRAQELGLKLRKLPLFKARPLGWVPPSPEAFDAIIVTSAHAMRLGGAGLSIYRHLPLLSVGEATAQAAREAGFAHVSAGDGDGAALVTRAVQSGYRRILHVCGAEYRGLNHPDASIEAIPVYAADPVDPPPLIAGPGTVLIHSPRAAALAAKLVKDRSALHLVAISPAALAEAGSGWRSAVAAPTPTDDAMLAIAAAICHDGQ
jgi:uroporphyrinogen-III synthase